MNAKLTTTFKKALSKLLPDSEKLRYLVWLPKLETFHKAYGKDVKFLASRHHLYDYINQVLNNEAIAYCEFGVFKGASIKYWSQLNTHATSEFHGFDTFSGLPESWDNFTGGLQKGFFDVKGELPHIDDARVHFYKGLFQDTLPGFLEAYQLENTVVINIDADLYSSTLYVLTMAHGILKKGSVIIFDEFSSMLHEFRAFEDYCKAYNVSFEVLAATASKKTYYAHVAVRIL
ncbi:TylF/MycF/NovP-related O-methyltransferase [Formosa maritima]|uniref:Macrocin O-methyltransferase n=1 Tax=Formosa maritima TaxID=2592046 RepID=A0A5D0GD77_9FLAO|nr:TylF/MycF/NovP-related O-methyltransferase [Formosa maritima]TYA56650.1 macrocin O-methyltransferase [Formosa maritima]